MCAATKKTTRKKKERKEERKEWAKRIGGGRVFIGSFPNVAADTYAAEFSNLWYPPPQVDIHNIYYYYTIKYMYIYLWISYSWRRMFPPPRVIYIIFTRGGAKTSAAKSILYIHRINMQIHFESILKGADLPLTYFDMQF